jgi:excinuclease ABC subunit A
MPIQICGASEHNLKNIDVTIGDGLTVVTGVSGSGKTSLVFDTLYHESRRRFEEIYHMGNAAGRLAPAVVRQIDGLGPTLAVGQNLLNRNPLSTLASASGLHPFLRLLFARFGERHCTNCGVGLQILSQDEAAEHLFAAFAADENIQVWVPLVLQAAGSHRTLLALLTGQFDPEDLRIDGQAWEGADLDPAKHHNIDLRVVPAGERLSQAQARRVVGDVLTLGAYSLTVETGGVRRPLAVAQVCAGCGAWFGDLEPVHFHLPCPHCDGAGCRRCGGSGMHPEAAAVRWAGKRFPELLALTGQEAFSLFSTGFSKESAGYVPGRLLGEICRRLEALVDVGLGYIALDRPSPTLSRGESQRVRLAVALTSRLEGMLYVLDEPTIGQHPADIKRLLPVFRRLAGPVIYVEHERLAAAEADQAIDLGPGAGNQGGSLLYSGDPAGLWQADTPTGRFFSGRSERLLRQKHLPVQPGGDLITLHTANLRNLKAIDVQFPLGRLTVVSGVSGSGKSTLVEDVLVASMKTGKPAGCRAVEGPQLKPVLVDQEPIGRNPRSNPATYTKLSDILRDLFASQSHFSASHFSFNRPEGACPACGGMGAVEVAMRYLPSTWIPCTVCEAERFTEEVLSVRLPFEGRLYNIADLYRLPVSEVFHLFQTEEKLLQNARLSQVQISSALRMLEALVTVGLGYLPLGQPSPTLSGGEAQRVKLSKFLGQNRLSGQLLVLDEPSTGLHPQDLAGLVAVLDRLVHAGATVVVVEHNTDILRAADWVIDLGPGAGPDGGRLLYAGPPEGLPASHQSLTAQALRDETKIRPRSMAGEQSRRPQEITIRGARTHNLRDVSVAFPHGKLSVVTGVSGSGKSSLVMDVLETEARRRFLETLSMYERQGVREGAEAQVDSVAGLGVTVTITPERRMFNRRATVGAASEISHHLAALLTALGERSCLNCSAAGRETRMERGAQTWECPVCGTTAALPQSRHFSSSTYGAACRICHGVGTLQVPAPEKLIVGPSKPLCGGAMHSPGFFPKGYLCKPFNGGYDMVQALAQRYGFDPHSTPWEAMTPQAQQAFLFGDPEPLQVVYHSRKGKETLNIQPFPGFYGFIRDWDVGGTYTRTEDCRECGGAGLRPEYLAVTLAGQNVHELHNLPLSQLEAVLAALSTEVPAEHAARHNLLVVLRRLAFLAKVGLGYLHLGRVAATLSAGEAQRVRLAGLLGSGMTSLTVLLDEPTRGLHPCEVDALLDALRSLKDEGNSVIVVEHEPAVIQAADHLVEMGPGAGWQGGEVVAQGPAVDVMKGQSLTARWLRGEAGGGAPNRPRRIPAGWMQIRGACANNLKGEVIDLPLGVLAGVCGVSGSGKSTLVIDTLGRVLAPKKQTTSVAYEPVEPGVYEALTGAPGRVVLVDQARAGVVSPASFLGLDPLLRRLFAETGDARALGLQENTFTRSCSVCRGRGMERIDMGFLPAVYTPCETCRGTGFPAAAWEVRLNGLSLPELSGLTLEEVSALFEGEPDLARLLEPALAVGLGYLALNQPGHALSGGEAQRLKIAVELARRSRPGTLYILDEPTVGQHLADVHRLTGVLHRLVEDGASVLVVEHHPYLLAACDWLLEFGPHGGPQGGFVIAHGTPEAVASGSTPTAPYLEQALRENT